ncbi:unnamed protein product [Cyprideis torosa]|uniref:Uncharacterized protein n=1 Tax=Cyprideis torosa TaxID=163714 RepID=A0A7R8W6P3_9CRUS|nr:unnamed protein product [Cyprideis torosa]CAG0886753.1 unnamed protein product [Cyprideis torosa]
MVTTRSRAQAPSPSARTFVDKVDPFAAAKTASKNAKQRKARARKSGTSIASPSAASPRNIPGSLSELPKLEDAPPEGVEELLVRKIQQCCVIFDFNDPLADVREKAIKKGHLLEILQHCSRSNQTLSDSVTSELLKMLSANMFRVLPPSDNPDFDPEEDDPNFESAWPHLEIVYQIFVKLLESPNFSVNTAKQHIKAQFITKLLELFDSEDPRERDYLKTILHRIYGKFLNLRATIRKQIMNLFVDFIYETQKFNGVSELLEILGSIVNGFALPLKKEHTLFLQRVLIPLHKTKSLPIYHSHLTYCIILFVEKDGSLAPQIIKGILRFWPKTCSPKEVLFLSELDELIDAMPEKEFQALAPLMFKQIAKSIESPQFQVAERALMLWNNESTSRRISDYSSVILPIVFTSLQEVFTNHWNQTIVALVFNVLKFFRDINEPLFEKLLTERNKHMAASSSGTTPLVSSNWNSQTKGTSVPGNPSNPRPVPRHRHLAPDEAVAHDR